MSRNMDLIRMNFGLGRTYSQTAKDNIISSDSWYCNKFKNFEKTVEGKWSIVQGYNKGKHARTYNSQERLCSQWPLTDSVA